MKRSIVALAAMALALGALLVSTACTASDPAPRPAPVGGAAALPGPVPSDLALRPAPKDSPRAPVVTGRLTDGSPLAFADMWADRPVVLTFFSSWCSSCDKQQDAFSELARRYRDRVVFVGVASEDKPDDLQRYLRDHSVQYPVVLDEDSSIWRSYAVREPPAVVVIAKGGALLRGWPGGIDAATLEGNLRQLVFAP
jgi:peroxiredoxin